MKMPITPSSLTYVLLAGLFLSNPVLAEKPDHAGKGKDKQGQKHEKRAQGKRVSEKGAVSQDHHKTGSNVDVSLNMYFGDRQRNVVREYYTKEFHSGHCPPGLAKKHNGCMPPGQAKKWSVGHRLPHDVVYYDLPPSIVIELGTPPVGYKYVRVAKDILLIAVGTSMVIDAIDDLGNL
jgi:Ni/Co efflux regulator RcnB